MDSPVHDLATTPIHAGRGGTAVPLVGFEWSPESLAAYEDDHGEEGADARLVTWFPMTADWDSWEVHPSGPEVVLCVSGRFRLHQERDGDTAVVELGPGEYAVNLPGTWHTADVLEPGAGVFITSGLGTEHRPR